MHGFFSSQYADSHVGSECAYRIHSNRTHLWSRHIFTDQSLDSPIRFITTITSIAHSLLPPSSSSIQTIAPNYHPITPRLKLSLNNTLNNTTRSLMLAVSMFFFGDLGGFISEPSHGSSVNTGRSGFGTLPTALQFQGQGLDYGHSWIGWLVTRP